MITQNFKNVFYLFILMMNQALYITSHSGIRQVPFLLSSLRFVDERSGLLCCILETEVRMDVQQHYEGRQREPASFYSGRKGKF